MKQLWTLLLWALLGVSSVHAQSTVIPTVPGQNTPLNSAPVRNNFLAAYNDVNGLLGMHPQSTLATCPAAPLVGTDCLVQTSPTLYTWYKYMGTPGYAQVGQFNPTTPTFSPYPTINNGNLIANCSGTSPAIAAGCTWNNFANQAIGSTNGMLPYRTGGSWGTILTGTSGATIPLNNTTNVFSAKQTINLNSGSLQAAQTGTALQVGGANSAINRLELDAYANANVVSCVRTDGTPGAPAALVANDEICSMNGWGYNGSAFVGGSARVSIFASQNWSVGAQGTYIRFSTTANGATTLTDQVSIENDGGVTVPPTVTGGDKGAGTINATGLFVNGVAVSAGSSITSGTTNQLAWYAASGTTLSGLATANNGVLVTSAGGVPSISTTLPSGLTATNMALTTPSLGVATGTSLALGGASIGSNALAVTGTTALAATTVTTSFTATGLVTNADLVNSGLTLGSTALTLGATTTTIAGLTLTTPTINGAALSGTLSGAATFSGAIAHTGGGSFAGTFSGTPTLSGANFVTLANLAQDATAWSLLGNATSGTANYAPFTIGSLTQKVSPASTDILLLQDQAASGALKFATVSSVAAAGAVGSWNNLTGAITSVVPAQGRLTLASHTPVMAASQTSQTTLYYDNYIGNQVPFYTGSVDSVDYIASNEVSSAMQSSGTGILGANNVFDVWWEGNTNHKPCVATNGSGGGGAGWAGDTGGSNTARGTGYSQLDFTTRPYTTNANTVSVCVNGSTNYGPITANKLTYLGTILTDAASAGQVSFTLGTVASGGGAARIGVWNASNRVPFRTTVNDTGGAGFSWTYAVANTFRAADAPGAGSGLNNRVSAVYGINQDIVEASYHALGTAGASTLATSGVGLDTTTGFCGTTGLIGGGSTASTVGKCAAFAGVGLHFFQAVEAQNSTTASTWFGNNALYQSGLIYDGRY